MSYRVKVYNNAYYMDEAETYIHGQYPTYAAALEAAKDIVIRSIRDEYDNGARGDRLLGAYKMYGKDPVIISDDEPLPAVAFSAWAFADEYVGSKGGNQ